jgi:arabinofuranosyltransferase
VVTVMFVVWVALTAGLVAMWPRIGANRGWRWAAVAGALVVSFLHQLMFSTLAEDAFISFRYSQNLAEGRGLVFNVGEKVEGYSNFLWVVLVAIPHWLFQANIILTARVLGVLCALGAVVVAYLLATRISGSGGAGVLAAMITAASSSFAAYGPSGLETPLFGLLALSAVLALQADRLLVAGLLVALATMTRPDGVVLAVVIGVWLLVLALRGRAGWRGMAWYLAGAAVLVIPWTAWRVAYYGYLIPNAVAAKSGASLRWQLEVGWHYLVAFAVAAAALLVFVPIAIYLIVVRRRQIDKRAQRLVWLLFALAIVYLAFFTATGGDWMPAFRFFASVVPLLAVALAAMWALAGPDARHADSANPDHAAAASRPRPNRLGPALVGGMGAVLLAVSANGAHMKDTIDQWRTQVHELSAIGAWMRDTMPEGSIIATFANGALSYEAGPKLIIVDELGLTDEHIARQGQRIRTGGLIGHTAHDWDYILNVRRPDIVFRTGSGYSSVTPCFVNPELVGRYVAAPFRVVGSDLWAQVFIRNDRVDALLPMLDADPLYEKASCPAG